MDTLVYIDRDTLYTSLYRHGYFSLYRQGYIIHKFIKTRFLLQFYIDMDTLDYIDRDTL